MKIFERILALGLFLGLFFRDVVGFIKAEHTIMVCGTILGLFYLFSTWWTLKPKHKNTRTIIISILYGLACWSLMFTLIFKLLYLEGSDEMTIMSMILLMVAIGLDILTSIKKLKLINRWMIFRISILTSFALTFLIIPDDSRIAITYRDYPELLKLYEMNREKFSFFVIQREYFNNQSNLKHNEGIEL